MNATKLILGLSLCSIFMFNEISAQKALPQKFEVYATFNNHPNPSQGVVITCFFEIWDGPTLLLQNSVTLPYTGNGTYNFDSGYTFDSNDSFTFYFEGSDYPNNKFTYGSGYGGPGNPHIYITRPWSIPK